MKILGHIYTFNNEEVIDRSLQALLDHSSPRFDMVLLDSPPVLSVSDTLLLAPMGEETILIMATGTVTEKDAQQAKEQFEQVGGRVHGVILNRFT